MLKTGHLYIPFLFVPLLVLLYRFLVIISFSPEIARPIQLALLIVLPFILVWSAVGIVQNRYHRSIHQPPIYPRLKTCVYTVIAALATLSLTLTGFICLLVPGLFALKAFHLAPLYAAAHGMTPLEALRASQNRPVKPWNALWTHASLTLGIAILAVLAISLIFLIRAKFSPSFFLSILIEPTAIHEFTLLGVLLLFLPVMVIAHTTLFKRREKLESSK